MLEYYVLTLDPDCPRVINWICANGVKFDAHLNRTRFWVVEGSELHTEFLLRFSHCCPRVEDSLYKY